MDQDNNDHHDKQRVAERHPKVAMASVKSSNMPFDLGSITYLQSGMGMSIKSLCGLAVTQDARG